MRRTWMMKPVDLERVLVCDGLLLEPILRTHGDKLFDELQAPGLYFYIPHEPPTSIEELETRFERWAKRKSSDNDETWLNYAVFSTSESAYVGTLQATMLNSGKTYMAYEVFPRFWRRGIARSACRCLIDFLFERYQTPALSALVDTRNEASWRLLESLGFQRIATLKDADFFKGASSDEFAYELTMDAWRSTQGRSPTP
jgi:RimJ/RimL family protein N-acetyltransferase